ncbi:thiamine-phosphate kinase [Pseudoxanthomonas dokdonensis]|uniref:Thiamine-monophosphate kinase n=1 Tax=Pseudoxanthomonas dokdonensis TaxID=344882 RepID=A0A0R0CVB6_9GAMM|nr:thiamine-phosphate kinase [Pseudoxanthomonas dokdonensis]KRG69681.1 thiamine-monophosphate kinase [Pseudoxanthomonas dokdonensis]
MNTGEFDLIQQIRRHIVARDDVVLGIGDDAALLQLPANRQLVVAMDTLNIGVHFPRNTTAADIGWKALAVNLSDLAAMGAEPAWCTLSLSLPEADGDWLDGFLHGFTALARQHQIALVGGDTTRGPLSVCVTVHGLVASGEALRRDGARLGDDIWVSGSLGDAAAALALMLDEDGHLQDGDEALRQRLNRPTPRVPLGRALRGVAHAAIDVSDGLLADLQHICTASDVGARVQLAALPASDALLRAVDPERRQQLQATGGDDYELLFSAPVSARQAIEGIALATLTPLQRIGGIVNGERVVALAADGHEWQPSEPGYQHFSCR